MINVLEFDNFIKSPKHLQSSTGLAIATYKLNGSITHIRANNDQELVRLKLPTSNNAPIINSKAEIHNAPINTIERGSITPHVKKYCSILYINPQRSISFVVPDKINIDPKQIAHIEAIVLSMTPKERRNPEIIKASRKTRIAKGSGTSVQ